MNEWQVGKENIFLLTLESWGLPALDASQTFAELGLGGVELCDGGGQMLEFLVELLLDLGKLLRVEAVEVDYIFFIGDGE